MSVGASLDVVIGSLHQNNICQMYQVQPNNKYQVHLHYCITFSNIYSISSVLNMTY